MGMSPDASHTYVSAAQHINSIFPRGAVKWGPRNPKSGWAGKFQKIEGFCRISTETLGPGNSGEIHFGEPILVIWGDFCGEMRMAKVDMLGRGDT